MSGMPQPHRWLLPVLALALAAGSTARSETVRVGVYENEPKVFTDASGKASGLFIEILRHVAEEEGWDLEFVPGTWSEGLSRLREGAIDLMPDVAYSDARSDLYAFGRVPVLSSWFHVYSRPGVEIESILDLSGKRVAVLRDSIQQDVFTGMSRGFGLSCVIVPVEDYRAALELLDAGGADAVILNRFYGRSHGASGRIRETPVMFHPTELYFAAPKGRTERLAVLDRRLAEMKADPASAYFQVLRRWLRRGEAEPYPRWLLTMALILVAVTVLAVGWTLLLRWQVKRRTEELRRSEMNTREVFNGTHDAIIIHDDATGAILDVNRAMLDLFGYESREEVLSLSVAEISAGRPPYTGEEAQRWMRKAATEGPQIVEWCCRRSDGTEVMVEVALKATEIGGRGRMLAALRDITLRKEAERALSESERKFRSLTETLAAFVVLVQGDEIVYVNPAAEAILGHPPEYFIGMKFFEPFHPDDRAAILARRKERADGHHGLNRYDARLLHADGTYRWIDFSTFVTEFDGKPSILVTGFDVTERKEAEEALEKSEERWRKMYRESPVMMCAVDPIGRIQEVSDTWCETLGYTRDEILGMHRFEFFPREVLEEILGAWKDSMTRARTTGSLHPDLVRFFETVSGMGTEELAAQAFPEAWLRAAGVPEGSGDGSVPPTWIAEESASLVREVWEGFLKDIERDGHMPEVIRNFPLKLRRKTGEILDVLMTKILVRDEKGEIEGAFVVAVDVTEEKQLQAQLLHQDKIAAVGTLAAGVAHEIGNPLLAMSMATQSLMRKATDEYQTRKLGLIGSHIERITRIVQQMSDLARPPAEEKGRCDVNDIVRRALEIVQYDKRAKRSELLLDLAEGLPYVTAVEDHLVQVFINLALNAFDALDSDPADRPKRLTVRTVAFGEASRRGVRIHFEDTGPGIAQALLKKIFQPFFTTKEVGKGTGLGLAVSYRIVEEHGGRIDVDSRVGQGSRFSVELPAEEPR